MSNPAGNGEGPEHTAFVELERIVGAALEHLAEVAERAEMAEARNAEFEECSIVLRNSRRITRTCVLSWRQVETVWIN